MMIFYSDDRLLRRLSKISKLKPLIKNILIIDKKIMEIKRRNILKEKIGNITRKAGKSTIK